MRESSRSPPAAGPSSVAAINLHSVEEMVRIDHRFTDKLSVFGHYIQDSAMQTFGTTMWSGDNMPSIGNTFGNPSRTITWCMPPTRSIQTC